MNINLKLFQWEIKWILLRLILIIMKILYKIN